MRTIEVRGYCPHVWGCGVTRRIVPGDRVFLMKVGREPRGIVGSGWVITPVYEELYTDAQGRARASRCVEVHFDALLDPDDEIYPRAWLQAGIYTRMHWSPQASGVSIPAEVAAQLEEDWARFLGRPAPAR
jgi:hypothetical protein